MGNLELRIVPPRPREADSVFCFRPFEAERAGDGGLEPGAAIAAREDLVVIVPPPASGAVIVYPADTDRAALAKLALARAAGLTAPEKLIAIYRMCRFVSDGATTAPIPASSVERVVIPDSLVPSFSALIGRPARGSFLRKLLLPATWPIDDLRVLHETAAPIEQLMPLLELRAAERSAVVRLHAAVRLTASETRALTRWMMLVRWRLDFSMAAFVDDTTQQSPLPSGSDCVRDMRRLALPKVSRAEERISRNLKDLKLPPDVRVRVPENLEGDAFWWYFRFSKTDDVERNTAFLRTAIDGGSLTELINNLNDAKLDEENG